MLLEHLYESLHPSIGQSTCLDKNIRLSGTFSNVLLLLQNCGMWLTDKENGKSENGRYLGKGIQDESIIYAIAGKPVKLAIMEMTCASSSLTNFNSTTEYSSLLPPAPQILAYPSRASRFHISHCRSCISHPRAPLFLLASCLDLLQRTFPQILYHGGKKAQILLLSSTSPLQTYLFYSRPVSCTARILDVQTRRPYEAPRALFSTTGRSTAIKIPRPADSPRVAPSKPRSCSTLPRTATARARLSNVSERNDGIFVFHQFGIFPEAFTTILDVAPAATAEMPSKSLRPSRSRWRRELSQTIRLIHQLRIRRIPVFPVGDVQQ